MSWLAEALLLCAIPVVLWWGRGTTRPNKLRVTVWTATFKEVNSSIGGIMEVDRQSWFG